MEIQSETLLKGYSEQEKAAYLGALAALATSDREANGEELEHIRDVAHSAGLSAEQEQQIIDAAQDTSGNNLKQCLDTLKESGLRYSLITDLIALAKVDESYTEEEKGNIEKVSRYLNVNQNQFSVLDQFVSKTADGEHTAEEISKPNFLQSTGLQDKFANAGFNMQSIGKNLLGFLGPILLGGLASKALRGRNQGAGGLGGGGGLLGGLGGLLGGSNVAGGMGGMGGGLGSLLSGLTRSRSNGSMGGMLGRLFR